MRDIITESDELESLGLGKAGIVDRPKTMYGMGRTIRASRLLWSTHCDQVGSRAIDGGTRTPDPRKTHSFTADQIDLVERVGEL